MAEARLEDLGLGPEAVGGRSSEAASASLRGLVSTKTPGTTVGTKFSDLHLVSLPPLVNVGDCVLPIHKNTHCLLIFFLTRVQLVTLRKIEL